MSSPSETVIPSKESRKMSDNQAILMNIPPEILLDILSRLPIRTILRCKCVCRQFLELITSAAFAELHHPRSTPNLIIQHSRSFWCKMLEFEDEEQVHNHVLNHKQLMEFHPGDMINTPADSIRIVDSVNGLLCLVEDIYFNDFYICNPITHEYIALPELVEALCPYRSAVCGFGVSSSSGEYKLVRITPEPSDSSPYSPPEILPDLECMIYTLGTGSWRSIAVEITFNLDNYPAHAFLSGNLHWLVQDEEGYLFIACFNLETELFNCFPRIPFSIPYGGNGDLAILGDCLCVVCDHYPDEIVIWAMEDYGVGKSWTKRYVISYQVEGEFLFIWEESSIFYYSIKTETVLYVHFSGGGNIVAMLHTPSLLSLKRFDKENVASLDY